MRRLNVLVSGAGIAGCALAYWLARHGHAATVVERGGALRSSGAPVDVRGRAAKIAEDMGIVPRLREASIHVSGITFLDRFGRPSASVDLEALRGSIAPNDIELPRGDLATILHEASRNDAEFVFGDSIAALSQDDGSGVDVTFERAQPRRFDLVIGADGLHSKVRRLAFGPEADFARHAGLYVATLPLPRDLAPGREMMMLNAPGKCVTLHPSRDSPIVLFVFRHPTLHDFDHADVAQHKRILTETYADFGWKVPAFLDAVRASDDFYFDAVSRVDMPDWSSGRVALVGDAASCVSLFGDGSTLAICGGYTLAAALAEHPDDHAAAFRRYREEHGKLVAPRQKGVGLVASVLVPQTQFGIALRNHVLLRALSAFAAVKRLARR